MKLWYCVFWLDLFSEWCRACTTFLIDTIFSILMSSCNFLSLFEQRVCYIHLEMILFCVYLTSLWDRDSASQSFCSRCTWHILVTDSIISIVESLVVVPSGQPIVVWQDHLSWFRAPVRRFKEQTWISSDASISSKKSNETIRKNDAHFWTIILSGFNVSAEEDKHQSAKNSVPLSIDLKLIL